MKTNELLKLDPAAMADAIKAMKLKECEKHARNYAERLKLDYAKFLRSAAHAVLVSEQEASVVQRVSTNIWGLMQRDGGGTQAESEILAMLLLMFIHKLTDGFKHIERLTNIPAKRR